MASREAARTPPFSITPPHDSFKIEAHRCRPPHPRVISVCTRPPEHRTPPPTNIRAATATTIPIPVSHRSIRCGIKVATETHPILPLLAEEPSSGRQSPPEDSAAGRHCCTVASPPPHHNRNASVRSRFPLYAQWVTLLLLVLKPPALGQLVARAAAALPRVHHAR
jgi:hypothetical protein